MSSKDKYRDSVDKKSGLDTDITRRDFVGGSILGAGAGLLAMSAPGGSVRAAAGSGASGVSNWPPIGMGPDWTGPSGSGDYANSNGNTHRVVNSAHAIAQKLYSPLPENTVDTDEVYDVVAVGGGFAGLSTAYTTTLEAPDKKVLVIDNHPIFGGEGKMNIMDVDGDTYYAPQGSNDFCLPTPEAYAVDFIHPYWEKLGIPTEFRFVENAQSIKDLKVAKDNFGPQAHQIFETSLAHYYFDKEGEGGTWDMNPWETGLKDAPISEEDKEELMRFIRDQEIPKNAPKDLEEAKRWLDGMSYKDYIEKEKGYSPKMTEFMDWCVATGSAGVACDAISAYQSYEFVWPGMAGFFGEDGAELLDKLRFGTFPGGNAGIARYFVKAMIPDAIEGKYELEDIHNKPINRNALDRPSNQVRIRLAATGVHIQHDGDPDTAKTVTVAYEKEGKVYKVKARSVVMCSGGWVNKYICKDVPPVIKDAFEEFNHGPMLTVNVALRNWKFLEKLGASAVRWFDGEMGFWLNIRRPMDVGDSSMPLDPEKPVVISNYVSFPSGGQGLDAKQQGALGRTKLFSMSYKDIEDWVIRHYTQLFAEFGFDAERDIAGIITNRWGHAYMAPGPGFHYDRDGKKSPMNIVREGYGRVFFGHSETSGRQLWNVGVEEGRRATMQALAKL